MVAFLARRYAEVIEVTRGDDAPAQFVWRGRHYTVREVLAHWIRTGAWWQQVASGVIAGNDPTSPTPSGAGSESAPLVTVPIPPAPRWGQRAWGEPAPDVGAAGQWGEIDDDEREYWRVEATVGRAGHPVIVEVCFAWATGIWTVTSVGD